MTDDEIVELVIGRMKVIFDRRRDALFDASSADRKVVVEVIRSKYKDELDRLDDKNRDPQSGTSDSVYSRPGSRSRGTRSIRKCIGKIHGLPGSLGVSAADLDKISLFLASHESDADVSRDLSLAMKRHLYDVESKYLDSRFSRSVMMSVASRVSYLIDVSIPDTDDVRRLRKEFKAFVLSFSRAMNDGAFVDDRGRTNKPQGRRMSKERSDVLVFRTYGAVSSVFPEWDEMRRAMLAVLVAERLAWSEAFRGGNPTDEAVSKRAVRLLHKLADEKSTNHGRFSSSLLWDVLGHGKETTVKPDAPLPLLGPVAFLSPFWVNDFIPATAYTPLSEWGHEALGDEDWARDEVSPGGSA